jgi:hypothetical protein
MSANCCGSEQALFAMKAVTKDVVSKHVVSRRIVEKEVFMRAVGHPFLVQLHSFFESEVLHI